MTTALAPHFERVEASDTHPDLILMWQALQKNLRMPSSVSEEMYESYREGEPGAIRGFVGFACSFGGKWFGGYARSGQRNIADEASRSLVRDIRKMLNVSFMCRDYREIQVTATDVIYCDPPYADTTEYRETFNSREFWEVAKQWSLIGASVYVSEYRCPYGWETLWENERTQLLRVGISESVTEKLFIPQTRFYVP